MIPLPANLKAVLVVILVAVIGALQALGHLSPAYAWAGAIASVLASIEMFLTQSPVPAKPVAPTVPPVVGALLLCLGLVLSACTPAKTVVNDGAKVVKVVVADIEAHDSDGQIASDVCQALGGSASTDAACANVATIVADAITFAIDSGLLSPAALAHAKQSAYFHAKPVAVCQ